MKTTRLIVAGSLLVICAFTNAKAAFIVEADNVGTVGKAFDHFVSTPPGTGFQLSATPSQALGLSGDQSAFGNPANSTGPDRYTLSYTPGVDLDNTTFSAGTVLGNSSASDSDGSGPSLPTYTTGSQLATGLTGGSSGVYNVYFTVPASVNVNPAGSTITISHNASSVVLNPVVMNSGGTGPDEIPGGTYTGGANNRWLKVATVSLVAGTTYSVVIQADASPPDSTSQRTHGVMWEYVAASALVTVPWTVVVSGGIYDGVTGTGSFTYDQALLDGAGNGSFGPTNGLTLSLTLLGQTFTHLNDVDFNAYPVLTVTNHVPTFMNYIVSENDPDNPTAIDQPGVNGFNAVSSLTPDGSGGYQQTITVDATAVPEPGSTSIMAIALLATMCKRRNRKSEYGAKLKGRQN